MALRYAGWRHRLLLPSSVSKVKVDEIHWKIRHVFIASPSDLLDERTEFPRIVDQINRNTAHPLGVHLEPLGWEETLPGAGRPQSLINDDVKRSHLFIMLLWRRWGSAPGSQYTSGTEEEYELARQLLRDRGFPHVLVYFRSVPQPMLADPGEQLRRVLDFRKRVEDERSLLFKSYDDLPHWERLVTEHVSKWLHQVVLNPGPTRPDQLSEGEVEPTPLQAASAEISRSAPLPTDSDDPQMQLRKTALDLASAAAIAAPAHPTEAEELYARAVQTYPDLSILNAFGLFYLRLGAVDRAERQFHDLLRLASRYGEESYREAARTSLKLIVESRPDPPRSINTIERKARGESLSRREIKHFVDGLATSEIPDSQAAALLMAVYFQGLDARETAALTEALVSSGEMLDLSEFPQRKVDTHGTGGVGDKTSLVVGPAAAAGGLMVPMLTGRGLGHIIGTIDKLDAIPGLRTNLSSDDIRDVLRRCGLVIAGQTVELAIADRKLYALRDMTATVDSVPLITASILSKKLAEGVDGLVVRILVGSATFIGRIEDARVLARSMHDVAQLFEKRVHLRVLATRMDQPIGYAVGRSLEVREAIETLEGRGPADLIEVCREVTAHMFVAGGIEGSLASGRARFDFVRTTGRALETFTNMIAAQGGDTRVIDDSDRLGWARHREPVAATSSGYVAAMDARGIGLAAAFLGPGRQRPGDTIDPVVGVVLTRKVGDRVEPGEPICVLHANDAGRLPQAREMIQSAIEVSERPPAPAPPLVEVL
jgi:pyrimidine-nucleoside phosphorylase/thymidine phosphorylase